MLISCNICAHKAIDKKRRTNFFIVFEVKIVTLFVHVHRRNINLFQSVLVVLLNVVAAFF
jgi:hypothetical protein